MITRFRSLFSQPLDFDSEDLDRSEPNLAIQSPRFFPNQVLVNTHNESLKDISFLDMTTGSTLNVTHRLSGVKRILTNLATPSSQTQLRSHAIQPHVEPYSASVGSGFSLVSQSRSASSVLTGNTPPLTPDSCNGLLLSSPISPISSEGLGSGHPYHQESKQQQDQNFQETGVRFHDNRHIIQRNRDRSHSQTIKEGKQPERFTVRSHPPRAGD